MAKGEGKLVPLNSNKICIPLTISMYYGIRRVIFLNCNRTTWKAVFTEAGLGNTGVSTKMPSQDWHNTREMWKKRSLPIATVLFSDFVFIISVHLYPRIVYRAWWRAFERRLWRPAAGRSTHLHRPPTSRFRSPFAKSLRVWAAALM